MKEKKEEKIIDLDDLEGETPLPIEVKKTEERVIELGELEDEDLKAYKKKEKKLIEERKKQKLILDEQRGRFQKKFSSNDIKAQKNWLFKKIKIGPKRFNISIFGKVVMPLYGAYYLWQARLQFMLKDFKGDELMAFAYSVIQEPVDSLFLVMTLILIGIGIFFMSQEPLYKYEDTYFVFSADGVEGVDTVVPITTKYIRRKMRWNQVEEVKVNELAIIPHASLICHEKSIIEIPLAVSEPAEFVRGLDEFCPDEHPMRLIINKIKKS